MKKLICLLVILAPLHSFSQTIYEKMKERFEKNRTVSVTVNGGFGIGSGWAKNADPSFLFDFPAGFFVQYHKGLFGVGGGARIQKIIGWYNSGSSNYGNIQYTVNKYFVRAEYIFSEVSIGYLGASLEGGPVELTSPLAREKGGMFINAAGNYLIELNQRWNLLIQYTAEFIRFKTDINSFSNYQNIMTNQLTFGVRMNL